VVPESAQDLLRALAALPPASPERIRMREEAIAAWLPLSRLLAARYARRGDFSDDLRQTAAVGLIKAIDRYDPERGVDFAAYAVPTVLGEIKRHFRDHGWSVRPPRRLQEMHLAITEASHALTHENGHSPTAADIAVRLGVSEEEVLEGLESGRAYSATSLSTPVHDDGSIELGDPASSCFWKKHGLPLCALPFMPSGQRTSVSGRRATCGSIRLATCA